MSRLKVLSATLLVILLLTAGAGAGAWYYLFGAPDVPAAELVPANTLVFATIPNGAAIYEAYQTSQAKQLFASPNIKLIHDEIITLLGSKNADLLHTFAPNLSGQSFIAITHYDPDRPGDTGFIAAMKPKEGLGDFGAFLDKFKATYGDELKGAFTGEDTIEGHTYDWIRPRNMPEKLCVANVRGWIVTTLGEGPLQDWIERFEKRSTTSSLAEVSDYRASLGRIGDAPMSIAYVNCHDLATILQAHLPSTDPTLAALVADSVRDAGGMAVGTSLENGQLVDRYSFLVPRQAQFKSGLLAEPCAFDTLKFTSRDTRLYWATNFNWKQCYANLREQVSAESGNPTVGYDSNYLQDSFRHAGIDVEHNIVDALGPEVSIQAEWNDGVGFPEVGLFVKLDKPDDFKPVISAVLDAVRKEFATSAVINEISNNGQNFATLNFVSSSVLSPTITEDGPYLGVFLTANQAVRSYQRDQTLTLAQNANFKQQIGDQRATAQQLIYLDSPVLLNNAYKLALPYLSLAAMFNKDIGKALQDHPLPDDLAWLAPIGTWSCTFRTDDSGLQAYSISGIGNQGIYLSLAAGAGLNFAQSSGLLGRVIGPFLPTPPPISANPISPPSEPPPPATPAVAPAPALDLTNTAPAAPAHPVTVPDDSAAVPSAPAASATNSPVHAPASSPPPSP